MNAEPRPYNSHLIQVSLAAADWNLVLNCIAKQPWETVDPVMQAIRQQVFTAVQGGVPSMRQPQVPAQSSLAEKD